jgi:hypothetical protein
MNFNTQSFNLLLKSYSFQELSELIKSVRFELQNQLMDDEDADQLFSFVLRIDNALRNA